MVMHYATSNKAACGRNIHNLTSAHAVAGVTCKTCRSSETFRAALAATIVEPAPVTIQMPASTSTRAPRVAFHEWLRKLGRGDRLPRGRYFAGKQAGDFRHLLAYQVGDSDVVAAFDPHGAIAAMCEQTGQELGEWDSSEVQLVSDQRLDALEVLNQDDGLIEQLKTSLRQDLAALTKPAYLYGWE